MLAPPPQQELFLDHHRGLSLTGIDPAGGVMCLPLLKTLSLSGCTGLREAGLVPLVGPHTARPCGHAHMAI